MKNSYMILFAVVIFTLATLYLSRDHSVEVIFYGEEESVEEEIVAELMEPAIDDSLVDEEREEDPPITNDTPANPEWTKEYQETPTLPQVVNAPIPEESPIVIDQSYSTTEITRASCETTPLHIPGTTFVIASCNVGASVAGTDTDSYGSYFQRGNNYAFPRVGSYTVSTTPVVPEIWYASATWITASPWGAGANWDNLRGGAGDTTTANGPGTAEDRQGPCPSGYHVPSTLEWAELFAEYAHIKGFSSYTTGQNLNLLMCIVEPEIPIYYSVSAVMRCIDPVNDFKLPKVSPRSEPFCELICHGDACYEQCMLKAFSDAGYYRSSSSTGNYWHSILIENRWNMSLTPQVKEETNVGMPVRCFSNLPYIDGTLTYSPTGATLWSVTAILTLNTTWEVTSSGWVGDGITFTKVYTKNTYENVYFQNLLGDQTGSKYVNVSKIQPLGTLSYSTTALTSGDVTVTLTLAETGQILSPGRSGSGLIYTKTYTYDKTEEVRVKNVIRDREETLTVSISNIARILNYIGQSCATAPDIEFGWGVENGGVTVQACNLWASVVGVGQNSYGDYFQWGNNHGFTSLYAATTRTESVDTSAYGPNNYYTSTTFRNVSGDWSDPQNQDLWGNLTDTTEARQGPCPEGYHVPTTEWDTSTIKGNIQDKLQLPKAGAHHGDSMEGNGLFGLYRRSDYKNASLANSFDFGVTETPWIYLPLPVVPVPVAPEEPLIDTVSTLVAMPPAQYPLHPSNNSYGLSIRCFKNKPQISGIVEVLPTPVEAEKEEVINQITLNQPGSILTSGWSCVEPSPCPTYDTYSGGTTWIKTFTPSTLTDLSEEVIFKDVSSSATWRVFVYIPILPENQKNWSAGGTSLSKDNCSEGDKSSSYYDGSCESSLQQGKAWGEDAIQENDEHNVAEDTSKSVYQTAYERAKGYGITTASTYNEVRISDPILRQEMAKMISAYAIKLFQKTPDTSKIDCSQFSDLSNTTTELQSYVIQSCQLGLMGMEGDGIGVQENFFPKSNITRAEVGTILSRLLRGTKYSAQPGDETYYDRHLQALKEKGIMKVISNAENFELRGNILLMFWKISSTW